jgi:hypothetical protein
MKSFTVILLCLFLTATGLSAQIVHIDTLKSTYVYKKPQNSIYSVRKEYLYSIGIRALGIEQFPKILNQTNFDDYITVKFNGFTFKFNDNQLSYRISGNLYDKDISFANECEDCEQMKGRLTDLTVKLGVEKNLTYSFIQPYFGADLGFRRNSFKGESMNAAPYTVKAEKNGAVLGPFIGIKFNLVDRLTIGAESGIDMMYSYERQEKSYHDAGKTQTLQKSYKLEFLTRPLTSLFLQYNFGSSD